MNIKIKKTGLKSKIQLLSTLPALALGLVLSVFSTYSTYRNAYDQVYSELRNMCFCAYEFIQAENYPESGDTEAVDKYFNEVNIGTDIELSYFKGDKRYVTTITDTSGDRITGTEAPPEVAAAVLKNGEEYFQDGILINGVPYFGYYMPIKNSAGEITGMTFAGKNTEDVKRVIRRATFTPVFISILTLGTVIGLTVAFSVKLVDSINIAMEFLNSVSAGDMECKPGKKLLQRTDEIGAMGRAAVKLQQSLKFLISSDPLTELLNRRGCCARLDELQSDYSDFTAIMGDIDFFKKFNDKYGHACGDLVLKSVSSIFKKAVGNSGFVSRWGGEEFLIIINNGSYEEAMKILRTVCDMLKSETIDYDGNKLTVTMTFGVQKSIRNVSYEEIINLADDKLYFGKTHGRNCIVENITADDLAVNDIKLL